MNNTDVYYLNPPKSNGIDNLLPSMLSNLDMFDGELKEGMIVTKHEAILILAILMGDPEVRDVFIKVMNFDLPSYEATKDYDMDHPMNMFHVLLESIRLALHNKAKVKVAMDIFIAQFTDDGLRPHIRSMLPKWAEARSVNAENRFRLSSFEHFNPGYNFEMISHNQSEWSLQKILHGLRTLNPHLLSDGLPLSPLNVFRYHDHRKVFITTFYNGYKILLLPTFNFDGPTSHDCALIVFDQEIIHAVQELMNEPIPRNHVIHFDNLSIYQDGVADLNPGDVNNTSMIMPKVSEMIKGDDTEDITWSSQFLPDTKHLHEICLQLESGKLKHVDIFCPNPSRWSSAYKLSGGYFALRYAWRLAEKFPGRFNIHFTQDRYLHAKFIVKNRSNTERSSLLFGSHNFNSTLVKSRTTEICFYIDSISLTTREGLERFIKQLGEDIEA